MLGTHELKEEVRTLGEKLKKEEESLRSISLEKEELEQKLRAMEPIVKITEEVHRIEKEITNLRGKHCAFQLKLLRADQSKKNRDLLRLNTERKDNQRILDELTEKNNNCAERLQTRSGALQSYEQQLTNLQKEQKKRQNTLTKMKAKHEATKQILQRQREVALREADRKTQISDLEQELGKLKAQQLELQKPFLSCPNGAQLQEVCAGIVTAERQASKLTNEERGTKPAQDEEENQKRLSAFRKSLARKQNETKQLRAVLDAKMHQLRDQELRAKGLEGKKQAQEQFTEKRRGCSGVESEVLRFSKQGVMPKHGTLERSISVSPKFASAVGNAFGRKRLSSFVVKSRAVGSEFIQRTSSRSPSIRCEIAQELGGKFAVAAKNFSAKHPQVHALETLVETSDPLVQQVVDRVASQWTYIPTMQEARGLFHEARRVKLNFVTEDGDKLFHWGEMASATAMGSSFLSKSGGREEAFDNELSEIKETLSNLRTEINRNTKALQLAEKEEKALLNSERELSRQITSSHTAPAINLGLRSGTENPENHLRSLRAHLLSMTKQGEELLAGFRILAGLRERIRESTARLQVLEQQQQCQPQSEESTIVEAELEDFKTTIAAYQNEIAELDRQRSTLRAQITDLRKQQLRTEHELSQISESMTQCQLKISRCNRKKTKLVDQLQQIQERILTMTQDDSDGILNGSSKRRAIGSSDTESEDDMLETPPSGGGEDTEWISNKMAHINGQLLSLEGLLPSMLRRIPQGFTADHAQMVERFERSVESEQQLRVTVVTAKKAWETKRAEYSQALLERLSDLATIFKTTVKELLPYAECTLEFDDDVNRLLEDGVNLKCKLGQQQELPFSALSGGQQAICAIALNLSCFIKFRPPLVFLDEIDASLDSVKTKRVSRLLNTWVHREHTKQMFVISHRPEMLVGAKSILVVYYGVQSSLGLLVKQGCVPKVSRKGAEVVLQLE